MAKTLQQIFTSGSDEINQNFIIESWHVSQSVDAFTGEEAYDITVSGSLTIDGNFTQGSNSNQALGDYSHAEGENTLASGDYSHAEGQGTTASGNYSHAEGFITVSSGNHSHAEGVGSEARGLYSHAEGQDTIALGQSSHTEGVGTIASGSYQLVIGRYNTYNDNSSLFIVGNGPLTSNRKDAFKVTSSGSIMVATQSSYPSWEGREGEIVPAKESGNFYLYVYIGGMWRSSSLS